MEPCHAVIVDPYGGARDFVPAFRARGVETVALLSDPGPLASYAARWHPGDFARVHAYDGDFDELLRTVKAYDPICIVPGNEHAVELTASLVEVLMPEKGNVIGSAPSQRDKWQMALALERAGVPRIPQICTDQPAEVADWIRHNGLTGRPLVFKPPKSGGTDNVHMSGPGEDWRPHFDAQLGYVNRFDIRTDRVLVQEYAQGPEFIVDLYSVDGRHGLANVCRYVKHSRGSRIGIYDAAEYLPPGHPEVAMLFAYTKLAADAVGIRNGSTHAEVIVTVDGPRLVEIASRLSGGCMMASGRLATGDCQIDRTVRHYLDGEFSPGFELVRHVRTMWLGTEQDGVLRNIEILEGARDLPTVHSMDLARNGTLISCTEDAFTELGWIILGGCDEDAMEADYQQIKEWERQVVVEPVGAAAPLPIVRKSC